MLHRLSNIKLKKYSPETESKNHNHNHNHNYNFHKHKKINEINMNNFSKKETHSLEDICLLMNLEVLIYFMEDL